MQKNNISEMISIRRQEEEKNMETRTYISCTKMNRSISINSIQAIYVFVDDLTNRAPAVTSAHLGVVNRSTGSPIFDDSKAGKATLHAVVPRPPINTRSFQKVQKRII